jgi:uncharacterized protein (DUF427 family)
MPKASWNGAIIAAADADDVKIVEGNVYFPYDAVDKTYLHESKTKTVCHWKGTASYYDVAVEGEINRDAAWYYPSPKPEAAEIAGYVAFWKGVEIAQDE